MCLEFFTLHKTNDLKMICIQNTLKVLCNPMKFSIKFIFKFIFKPQLLPKTN